MTSWLLLALAAQVSGSAAIYCDKIALAGYVRSPSAVFVIAGSFDLAVGVVLLASGGVPHLRAADMAAAAVAGVCFMLHLLLYFRALFRCSALSTGVLFQLVAVFSLMLALASHDSAVTGAAVTATALIVVGAVIFSFADHRAGSDEASIDADADGDTSARAALLYMVPATALLATSGFLLDTVEGAYKQSLTVALLAGGLAAPVIAGLSGLLRAAVAELARLPRRAALPVVLAESFAFGYQILIFAALASGPAAYVFAIEGVQPIILLMMGLGIAWLAPQHATETFTRRVIGLRLGSAVLIVAGVVLLAAKDAS